MRGTTYTIGLMALMASAPASAGGPSPGIFGGVPGPGTIAVGHHFDGRRVTSLFIERNFDIGPLISYGECEDGECDLYFTEMNSSYTDNSTLIVETTTWMLVEDTCEIGSGCKNGYQVVGRANTNLVLDGEQRETRGVMTLELGQKMPSLVGTRVALQPLGEVVWTEDSSGYWYDAYDPDGKRVSGHGLIASTFASDWCTRFFKEAAEYGPTVAGGIAGAATTNAIVNETVVLTTAVAFFSRSGAGLVAGTGLTLATVAGSLALVGTKTGLEALIEHIPFDSEQFCDTLLTPGKEVRWTPIAEEIEGEERESDEDCPTGTYAAQCYYCAEGETVTWTDEGATIEAYESCGTFDCCVF
ncbi:MAG: hypothetical protein AAFV53_36595 [Myxococcota bacterium]